VNTPWKLRGSTAYTEKMKPQNLPSDHKTASVSRSAAAAKVNQSGIGFAPPAESAARGASFGLVKPPQPQEMSVEEAVEVWRNEGDPN
jgi:hypothetical protein